MNGEGLCQVCGDCGVILRPDKIEKTRSDDEIVEFTITTYVHVCEQKLERLAQKTVLIKTEDGPAMVLG